MDVIRQKRKKPNFKSRKFKFSKYTYLFYISFLFHLLSFPRQIQFEKVPYTPSQNNSCSICFEEYKKREEIVRLKCNHYFHEGCITVWIDYNPSCPMCRNNL